MKNSLFLLGFCCFMQSLQAQNVGIGTSTPQRLLHVNSSSLYAGLMLTTPGTGTTTNDGIHLGIQFQEDLPGNRYGLLQVKESIPFYLGTNTSTTQLRFLADGNLYSSGRLGLGTQTPLESLDVTGNLLLRSAGRRIIFRSSDGSANIASVGIFNETTVSIAVHEPLQNSKFFFNVVTEKMGIGSSPGSADGYLFVNQNSSTSVPHVKLRENQENDYARLEFTNSGASRVWHIAGLNVAGTGTTNRENDLLNIWNSSRGDIMSFRGDGRVGILTTTPANGYALSVRGRIMCEELRVQLFNAWPDYVFADSYQLKSLQQVEQFILENKHLPGIPSAAEVEKDGIQVGEMQKKMMEKIEELTLYIIQQQKEIDALKTQRK